MSLDGLVVVDKPSGRTSHDVVARCRRLLSERKVGHGGTLDPDATGILLVGVGRVTRLLRFLSALPKTYTGEIVLGRATDTLDASGRVTGTWDMSAVDPDQVRVAAGHLTGELMQVPPMVSAIQIDGQRLHQLARRGIEVERAPRPVRVERFTVEPEREEPGVYRFEVHCSSGTYVRSLADDLGRALGGGAHLRALRRVAVGPFGLDRAVALEEVAPPALLAPAAAVSFLAGVAPSSEVLVDARHGRPLEAAVVGAEGPGPWAVLDERGGLVGVYEPGEGTRLRAAVIVQPANAGA